MSCSDQMSGDVNTLVLYVAIGIHFVVKFYLEIEHTPS